MDLNQLGALLRERRETAGLSLADVVERTKISRRVLESIEHGRLEDLPHPVYTKGFIRNYANVLGLDLNEINASLVEIFPVESDENEEAALEVQRDVRLHVGRSGRGPRLLTAAVVLGLLVSAIVLFIWFLPGENGKTPQIETRTSPDVPSEQPSQPFGPAPSGQQPEIPAESPVAPTPPEAPAQPQPPVPETSLRQSSAPASAQAAVVPEEYPVAPAPEIVERPASPQPGVLVVTAVEPCWFEVVVDGKSPTEYFLQPGERLTAEYSSGLTLRAGNAGGIALLHNGSPVSFEAGSGDVKTFTFP
ncbi:transcriptional regulator, XRE family [Alkalidesulfovibrio alkalitolerans DSM 16529]|uniref:Transcriptional regulator, XRE family n=1 Tax=Alkalidesulfovibrio alkalitolerans DSM 16529 TaxID=1121439 RepID=S7T040_9BACT|nr:helix-turn-helix domain-containing protein [Alkalidesulfovibrio alkalitolerans]EPR30442.1 transcriptional regulator, XRE family [Alkalidesulfovibrio alkalitolerans DSM 16529]